MKKLISIIILTILTLFCAQAKESPARKIMEDIEKKNSGFIGSTSEMDMILIDAYNKKVSRAMTTITREDPAGDLDKSITEFIKPLDVKGTKLLTWSMPKESNKLWLYLPRFKRVKKINSSGQSGSFMGSEFSYEDISGQQIDKYTYKLLKEDSDTWEIEAKPTTKSGYSKTVSTYSKEYASPVKIQYFDRKGELLKVSDATDFKAFKVGSKTIYYPEQIHMKNVQTKKESIIKWNDRSIGVKHSDNLFKDHKLK